MCCLQERAWGGLQCSRMTLERREGSRGQLARELGDGGQIARSTHEQTFTPSFQFGRGTPERLQLQQ